MDKQDRRPLGQTRRIDCRQSDHAGCPRTTFLLESVVGGINKDLSDHESLGRRRGPQGRFPCLGTPVSVLEQVGASAPLHRSGHLRSASPRLTAIGLPGAVPLR